MVLVLGARIEEPSRIVQFGMYQTMPIVDWDGFSNLNEKPLKEGEGEKEKEEKRGRKGEGEEERASGGH